MTLDLHGNGTICILYVDMEMPQMPVSDILRCIAFIKVKESSCEATKTTIWLLFDTMQEAFGKGFQIHQSKKKK